MDALLVRAAPTLNVDDCVPPSGAPSAEAPGGELCVPDAVLGVANKALEEVEVEGMEVDVEEEEEEQEALGLDEMNEDEDSEPFA